MANKRNQKSIRFGVVIPDMHVPMQNKRAVAAIGQFLADHPPDLFINLGDFLDFGGLSRHQRHSSKQPETIAESFHWGNEQLDEFDMLLPSKKRCRRVYILGNHEDRLDALLNNPPDRRIEAFSGLVSVSGGLNLQERGYEVIPYGKIFSVGKANFTHGWYAGLSHAKQTAERTGVNLIYAHAHDLQVYTHFTLGGLPRIVASLGCLCDLNPGWLRGKPNKWVHAFGVVEFMEGGLFTLHPIPIIKGKFSWNGVTYGG